MPQQQRAQGVTPGPEIGAETTAHGGRRGASAGAAGRKTQLCQGGGGHTRHVVAVYFESTVERPHGGDVETPTKERERRNRVGARAGKARANA